MTVGVVVIGRNEGERLGQCFASLNHLAANAVYVDSGSDDGSITLARARGAEVVELGSDLPFTAARARNAGFRRLMQIDSELRYVFFVDGDCEVVAGWMEEATKFLDRHVGVAAVSGLRRERFPDKSIYNLLINIEWCDYQCGESKFCGGDTLMRVTAFQQVEGYRADLICGEEPELCVRLRRRGWRIWRLNVPMTIHDAAMYRFGQWWWREVRTGYAFAQGAALHGAPPERHSIDESRRALTWGLGLPLIITVITVVSGGWGLFGGLIYPLQIVRLAIIGNRSRLENWSRAAALVLGKFPQMTGELKFIADSMRGAKARLIEYK